ncbi:MAG: hypothetical protein QOD71_389 [Thermoleophilaceae bacterium]|jgi:hypothetical protein|nr:hypothetical protein [Thermoleophilaceae bacterium]
MSTPGLSAVASFVFRSLHDHPHLRLPEAIAAGPASDGTYDVASVQNGLDELKERGLAEQGSGGRWHLTDAALSSS